MKTLREVIILTASYYSKPLSGEVLEMYAEDLADLPAAKCIEAYQLYRRNPKNVHFPLPAQIRGLVAPAEHISAESKARETAGRICGAVAKYGWNNWAEAKVYIGAEGWEVIRRQGGWQHVCENLGTNINPTAFQAQIRDMLLGAFQYGLTAIEDSIGVLPESRRGGLQPIGNIMNLIPSKE